MAHSFPEVNVEKPMPDVKLTPAAWIGYAVLALAVMLGFIIGGEAASFAQTGLMFVPFVVVAVLSYLGIRYPAARVLALLWLLALMTIYLLLVVGFSLFTVMDVGSGGTVMDAGSGGLLGGAEFDPEMAGLFANVGGLAVLSILIACMGFIPTVRRGVSRFIPLDPNSFVHAMALVIVTAFLLMSFAPLLVLGEPPLLTDSALDSIQSSGMTGASGLLAQIYTLVWTVPVAIFVVGYGVRRTLGQAFLRLGLVAPSLRQIALGVGTALLLVLIMNLLDLAINSIWQTMGWPRTDTEAFGELLAFALSPLGAIVIGVTAGLGEELGVRGVLQPRLGIVLSNLFFTSLHAFQYNWDALLVVFLLGATFGLLRKYTNTSTAAIAHGLYNFLVIMMPLYGISLFN